MQNRVKHAQSATERPIARRIEPLLRDPSNLCSVVDAEYPEQLSEPRQSAKQPHSHVPLLLSFHVGGVECKQQALTARSTSPDFGLPEPGIFALDVLYDPHATDWPYAGRLLLTTICPSAGSEIEHTVQLIFWLPKPEFLPWTSYTIPRVPGDLVLGDYAWRLHAHPPAQR